MSFKKSQVKQLEKEEKKEDDKVKKAMEILQEEQQKKGEAFLKDYKALCLKHGLELSVNPVVQWSVAPIKTQQS